MAVPYAEVIGDPIVHSKSPLIHKFWLEKLGLEADYRRTQVDRQEVASFLEERARDPLWRGCNVTMPLKEAVLDRLDSVTRDAARIGAVNTIRSDSGGRLHGRNTDVHGVWRSLDLLELKGATVVLIGAGGAARAAAFAIGRSSIAKLIVLNRSPERGGRLLADFRIPGEARPLSAIPAADLVINAAPLPAGDPPGLDALPSTAVVFDMVYQPADTHLLEEAKRRGLKVIDGFVMLTHQAAEAFSVFFGHSAPRQHDSELRGLLTS